MDEDQRPEPEQTADERATLEGFLDWQRATLAWKCSGLTDDQLRTAPIPPSAMSLLGLVRHLTDVERHWFDRVLNGRTTLDYRYWRSEGNDVDFTVADADVASCFTAWESECTNSRVISASKDLEAIATHPRDPEEKFSHRWIMTHMIEEYARHNGHADLLRELIDGATGE